MSSHFARNCPSDARTEKFGDRVAGNPCACVCADVGPGMSRFLVRPAPVFDRELCWFLTFAGWSWVRDDN